MDNKLSELSKPASWSDERGNLCTNTIKERGMDSKYRQDYEKYSTPLYSQEYVSALLARIEELEAIRADASQVFKEIGNELGCNPDNESIMMAIDELKKRLATPVRLPNKNDDEFWFDGVFQVAKFDRAVERAISAAGFKFAGDE
ncbi:TPA: hypothetical protein ACKPZK_002455 [Serratia marcescens]